MKYLRKMMCVMLIVTMLAAVLTGCGSKEIVMKEFKSVDETISIMYDETWNVEDMGLDNWIAAISDDESDAAFVMQLDEEIFGVEDVDDAIEFIEDMYGNNDLEKVESPSIPNVSSIEAYAGKMTIDGARGEGYIVYGETDYAVYAFVFVTDRLSNRMQESFIKSCESFVENAPEVETSTQVEITDTIRWINASYAILTHLNGWDYTIYAGVPVNETTQAMEQTSLEEWWGVTDRASADENMDWLLTEGHRAGFVSDMEYLMECGLGEVAEEDRVWFLLENFEMTDVMAEFYASQCEAYETYGEKTIAAWDYSRAMSVLSYYYIAGYYTETEALDLSLEVAKEIQSTFDSWDAYMESYMIGYEYWAEESSAERRDIYEELQAAEDNPYAIDWNLTLEKSW